MQRLTALTCALFSWGELSVLFLYHIQGEIEDPHCDKNTLSELKYYSAIKPNNKLKHDSSKIFESCYNAHCAILKSN